MKLFGRKNKKETVRNAVCIYGPPEMLAERSGRKPDKNSIKKPKDEVPEDIYGPPEMLGAITSGNAAGPTEEDIDVPDGEEDDI